MNSLNVQTIVSSLNATTVIMLMHRLFLEITQIYLPECQIESRKRYKIYGSVSLNLLMFTFQLIMTSIIYNNVNNYK
jgi:hypothetical protein